jgi:5-methylcytosine-specific restriction endonuclease McrA
MVFTVDRNGNPGHPTRRFDQLRKLLKRRQVRIIGGGVSGKPVTAVFLYKMFDVDNVATRKFVRVMDPGYGNIGFAVCEVKGDTLVVLCRGTLTTRIAEIKGLMDEKLMHRRTGRTIARFKMKRLSMQQGRLLTKFKQPRNVRSLDKSSATLQHGVDTHLALYGKMHKLCPLPVFQTTQAMEDNVFDIRTMTWGTTHGNGYQQSLRTDSVTPECLLCGIGKDLHAHHLIQRKHSGTNVAENKAYLCKGCHEDVHAGWCGRGASSGRPLSRSLNLDLALPERSSGWQSYENARPSHIIHNCS